MGKQKKRTKSKYSRPKVSKSIVFVAQESTIAIADEVVAMDATVAHESPVVEAVTTKATVNFGNKSIDAIALKSIVAIADVAIAKDISVANKSLVVEAMALEATNNVSDKFIVPIADEAHVTITSEEKATVETGSEDEGNGGVGGSEDPCTRFGLDAKAKEGEKDEVFNLTTTTKSEYYILWHSF